MANLWARQPITLLMAEAEEPRLQGLTTHHGVRLKRILSVPVVAPLGVPGITAHQT